MTEKDILRYLYLLDRRLYIIISSGSSWKPEYAHELEGIDRELAGLRELVSQEHGKRGQKGRREGVGNKEKAAPSEEQPVHGNQCGLEARIQAVEQRIDKIEQEALTLDRLKEELVKGETEFDYS